MPLYSASTPGAAPRARDKTGFSMAVDALGVRARGYSHNKQLSLV